MTNIQIPSGLTDKHIELFSADGKMMGTHSGVIKPFFKLPKQLHQAIDAEMNQNPSTILALELAGFKTDSEKMEKYAECRFGGFDFKADFKDGKLSEAEYHDCGVRGKCAMEGVVCGFFKVNGHVILPFEIEMIKLLATEDTLPVIYEKLQVSRNTFEIKKQRLFEKMKVLSRARLVAVCYDLQILNLQLQPKF